MFNCNGVFPISKCSGRDLKTDPRKNQKQYRLSSSHHLENKVSLTVINNGKSFAENQNNQDNASLCVTNVGGPGDYLSNMFRFNNKMYENNSGLDKKHGNYSRYLARKKGWNLINQNCIIDQTNICLPNFMDLMSTENNFYFNKIRPNNTAYLLKTGTYFIKKIPISYGFIMLDVDDASKIKLTPMDDTKYNLKINGVPGFYANSDANIPDNTKFYYGDIKIEVLGDFGKASLYEFKNGYKDNGVDLFLFDSNIRCA